MLSDPQRSDHNITSYYLKLDSENLLEDNVALLIQSWKERKHPSALDRMFEEQVAGHCNSRIA